jgi:hypothetical protein
VVWRWGCFGLIAMIERFVILFFAVDTLFSVMLYIKARSRWCGCFWSTALTRTQCPGKTRSQAFEQWFGDGAVLV